MREMRIFRLRGGSEYVAASLAGSLEQAIVMNFLAERDNPDPMCRCKKADEWNEIALQPHPGYNHQPSQNLHFNDAINASNAVQGASIIVSDHAKQLLIPHVSGECVFLPVRLEQAPQKYWLMYVTNVLDCLNVKDSKFIRRRFPPNGVKYYTFEADKLENIYLFRFPGHFDYLEDKDFATQRFLDLIQQLGLSGFEFWELNKSEQDPIVTGD
jgi:hypothetical protein